MTNHQTGHDAEKVAAHYLKTHGYSVRDINWKTQYCEIDIVAERDDTVYFVEVKYRKNSLQGSGFDYITPKKLQQMAFAAEYWVSANGWQHDYQLAAVEIDGTTGSISLLVDL